MKNIWLLLFSFLLFYSCKIKYEAGVPQGKYLFRNTGCNQKLRIKDDKFEIICKPKTGVGDLRMKKKFINGNVIMLSDSSWSLNDDTLFLKDGRLYFLNQRQYYKKINSLGWFFPWLHKLQSF